MDETLLKWRSGFARRHHQNPELNIFDDFNAAHQGRCAMLVIALWPDHGPALLRAAVTHDAAEIEVGDLSGPFKDKGGAVVTAHAQLEAEVLAAMGLEERLSPDDRLRLKLVDRLDAYLFAALRRPDVLSRDGWPETRDGIRILAGALGVDHAVARILMEATP